MKILGFNFDFGSRSSSWSKIRSQHLKRNPDCAACGRKTQLDVHHIEPVQIKPEKELDPENLITLCSNPCHFVFGHLMNYNSWNPDVIKDCKNYFNKVKNRPKK
jgi:5-methylcytosine-specific restriction endonuclease McrA